MAVGVVPAALPGVDGHTESDVAADSSDDDTNDDDNAAAPLSRPEPVEDRAQGALAPQDVPGVPAHRPRTVKLHFPLFSVVEWMCGRHLRSSPCLTIGVNSG